MNKFLSTPHAGWTNILIGDESLPASYLTSVPFDCLDNMIYAIQNSSDFTVSFDAEGYMYKILSDDYRTYLLIEKDIIPDVKVFDNITKFDIAKCLYNDISKDIDLWVMWDMYEDDDEELITENKKNLENGLEKLKSYF